MPPLRVVLVYIVAGCGGGPTIPDNPGWGTTSDIGDCDEPNGDVTVGSDQPDPTLCTGSAGDYSIAVCWDQVMYANPENGGPWCGYKNLGSGQFPCVGGAHPGKIFTCFE